MAEIVLKDRDGNDVNHAASTVRLKMSDGETQEFVNADTVALGVETTIEPDFSAGDMEVLPEEGTQFSKVTVNKPADLVPANIPEGMYIAGVGPGEFKGGSVAGVHYVTFMSHDGTTELYKRPVADGDNCADPVERGLISAPTKESTVQYDYSFVGWAASPDGAWDDTVLNAVTGDKAVYASFASVVRYYTITYYDDDGTTVLATKSFAYGSMPSYTPTKEGYGFTGWTPELAAVTGDASYTASWTSTLASGIFESGAIWSLSPDGVFIVSGTGAMDNYVTDGDVFEGITPWRDHIDSIISVVIEDGITTVGASAFCGCSNLESVSIPDSVTIVKTAAFYYCINLKSIIIPDAVETIENTVCCRCTNLESATIGSGVTSIGSYAFYSCSALTSATFKDTTTWYVGASAGETTTEVAVTDTSTAAKYLRNTYGKKFWTKV